MRWFVFVLLIAMMWVCSASADSATREKYKGHGFRYERVEVERLTPEEFLIMPWGWTAGDKQVLNDIEDCGFNMAGFVAPEHVKLVKKTGLKCIIDDPNVSRHVLDGNMSDVEIENRVQKMVAKFKNNPCVYGYYVMDEPIAPQFPLLARWASAIRKADPDAVPYINLLPRGCQGPGSKDYRDYIDQLVNVTGASYVSYDCYTLGDDGSVSPYLYMNLEAVRKASIEHGIPFWNIILADSHFTFAEVTQGGLNLQVYATLAHGARGISYFTYFAPLIGNYRNSAVDQFLHKTPTWDMLRLVNMQIHTLGPTYLKLKSVNVFHNENVPEICSGMGSSKYLSEITGGDFLVGEFEGPEGTPFVMIVNKDIHKSRGFNVKFKDQGTIMMTSPYTGETQPLGGENGWLAPGAGVLLSLQR